MIKNASSYSSMVQRIDEIRASRSDRGIAKEQMHDAELVAELLCRAGTNLRFAGELLSKLLVQQAPAPGVNIPQTRSGRLNSACPSQKLS